ncbi:MAG: hydantoinase/oxoprolinase family protein [Candidatus Rokubacteria bacterium]|nr:hydantoinase/oxoprolinase family protein [Candidatus Rokubacteria bacterium]
MTAPRIGIDVGGTFTDFVLLDEARGTVHLGKCLTTPADPSEGVLAGLAELLDSSGRPLDAVAAVIHGTTLVTNTIIERKGVNVGLVTTEGFRDSLEIGREFRYDIYDLTIERPEPLVPRFLRRGLPGRISATGEELRPLALDGLPAIVDLFRAEGVTSVAVSLIHSYANPVHERAVAEALGRLFPEAAVTLSVDLVPEIREYERTSTAVANAYVLPIVARYLGRLEASLRQRGLAGPFHLMQSNGSLVSAPAAAAMPIRLLESGPAGGAMAARFYGQLSGHPNLIAFDMGGTTAKMCLIDDGEVAVVHEFEAARVHRFKKGSGFTVKAPVIEMIEIGAGGGSIARVDRMGLLKVGPESAGADPGPACYGRGGTDPTVTDADLVLGHLNAGFFLGGRMKLDRDRGAAAVEKGVAAALGGDVAQAAAGIQEVVNANMATATRLHVAERGRDLRKYELIAFGGAGPVHAYRLAQLLRLRRVIFPLGAGTTSALGFLVAPMAVDQVRSYVGRLDALDWAHVAALYDEMEARGREALHELGVAAEHVTIDRSAEMRYVGQGFEIPMPLPGGPLGPERLAEIRSAFLDAYRRFFGRALEENPVEAITWRATISGPRPSLRPEFADTAGADRSPVKGRRPMYFADQRGFLDATVYDRYALAPGAAVHGPAALEERESTVVIGPGAVGRIDPYCNLVVELP